MAIAIDQATIGHEWDDASRTTYTLTTTAAVASGGFAVLGFICLDSPTTITSVTDDGPGLTWTVDKDETPNGVYIAIISAQAPSGMASGTTISVNLSAGGVSAGLGGCSFTGVATSSPVDGTPLGPTTASGTTAWSTGNYTVAAGSVIVGLCQGGVGTGNTATSPSVEIWDEHNTDTDFCGAMEYRIESGSGSVPVAGTWGSSTNSANIAVAYLAASAGPSEEFGASSSTYTLGITTVGANVKDGASAVTVTVTVDSTGAAYQVLNPSADSADGNWTDDAAGTALAAAIDEDTASDSDYIQSEVSPSSSGCRVKLESGNDPASSSGHAIKWRVGKSATGGETINVTVKLMQGGGDVLGAGTQIASFDRNNVDALTSYTETLSGTEADSITNYADLYLEFYASVA